MSLGESVGGWVGAWLMHPTPPPTHAPRVSGAVALFVRGDMARCVLGAIASVHSMVAAVGVARASALTQLQLNRDKFVKGERVTIIQRF